MRKYNRGGGHHGVRHHGDGDGGGDGGGGGEWSSPPSNPHLILQSQTNLTPNNLPYLEDWGWLG